MRVDLFDFDLPPELIAQAPIRPRDAARLLLVDDGPLREHVRARPAGPAAARRPPRAQRHPRAADPLLRPSRRGGRRGHPGRAHRRRMPGGRWRGPASACGRATVSSWHPGSWPRSPARTRRAGCGSTSRSRGEALLGGHPRARRHAAAALHPPAERAATRMTASTTRRVFARRDGAVAAPDGLAASDRGAARPPGCRRHRALLRHPACRRRHLRPGQGRGHRRASHARRMVRGAGGRGRCRSPPPAPAAAGSSPSARPCLRTLEVSCRRRRRDRCPVPARRACSSPRATGSASSTCC